MNAQKESGAQATNEQMIVFQFSENQQQMQTTFHNNEPWIVATDVCQILGLSQPTRALEGLDEDEKLTLLIVRAGQKREVNCINESGLYNLIFKSRKSEAKTFRKWVTSEVLPTIRKKGIYAMNNNRYNDEYVDLRDIPTFYTTINNFSVTSITNDEVIWFSVNDIHRAIRSTTPANQVAKKLNAIRTLAIKIYTYGNTHPSWFTNETGLKLILSGSRILKQTSQLALTL